MKGIDLGGVVMLKTGALCLLPAEKREPYRALGEPQEQTSPLLQPTQA